MCARMHRADWQYQCAHRPSPIALPPHCPPPIPRAIRVGCYRDAITRRQYAQAQPSDDPPFTWLAGWRPYWLLEMFRFGGFQAPTDALESPRVLPYILKVSKDILIIRISGNQFVSQARHHMALLPKYHALYLVPAPTQDNKADGEHFGACTRRRDLN